MPPRKSRRTIEKKAPLFSDPLKIQSPNAKKYFLELQGKTFIQEIGFEPLMIFCKEIWALVRYYRWERFSVTPKEKNVIPVVQEFYVSFKDQEMMRPYSVIWETVTVRSNVVHVTPWEICDFYNVQYYETNFLDNTGLDTFNDIDMDDIDFEI